MKRRKEFVIDACVVSHNTVDLTLHTLKQFERTVDLPVNLMCWDNASTDGSQKALVEYARSHPVTVISSSRNLGYGAALNRAFSMGNADYLLALNSDLQFPHKGWLRELYEYLSLTEDAGCVAPLLLDEKGRIGGAGVVGTVQDRHIRWWLDDLATRASSLRTPKDCISVCGAVMLMRREAFEECGGFDENFHHYFEETSLHRLMRVFGWRIVLVPRSRVTHLFGKSPNPKRNEHFRRGKVYFETIWGDNVRIEE